VARGLNKPVLSLETPTEQMAALRSPTRAAMLAAVRSGLDDLDSGRTGPLLARMAKDWTDGDLADLERYGRWCHCMSDAAERAQMHRVVDERNPPIADRIDAVHAAGQRVFAAVGSLHMIGPNGVPALLSRRGYAVERVPLDP
ncbi:MAG: TraB/GumN family protein, partial [Caldimonas sp.]